LQALIPNYLAVFRNDNLHIEQRTLSSFLMATYAILRLHWDAETVNQRLLASIPARLAFFRDYHGDSSYKLNIMDCLQGLQAGCVANKWFTSFGRTKFPLATNSHLDMNWIIPDVMLALKDPTVNRSKDTRTVSKAYVKELKRCGISVIVRLNSNDHNVNFEYYGKSYHPSDFKKEHFYHYDIPFCDVGTPTNAQVHQFVTLCERYGAGVAVHCHAGLGRTATMIGCYMIKHYNFTSRAVCGWLKLCRRGSVMGPQHFFLDKYQVDLENMQNSASVLEGAQAKSSSSEMINARFSRAVISPMVTRVGPPKATVTTSAKAVPHKNNIVHIAPSNRRKKNIGEQRMQKYHQLENPVENVESIRSKVINANSIIEKRPSVSITTTTTRPRSTKPSFVKASKSILHPKVVKSREESFTVIKNTPSGRGELTKETNASSAKKPRKQSSPPRLRYVTTPARKSQTKIEPMKSATPIRRHKAGVSVPSQESICRNNTSSRLVQQGSWGQWNGNIIDGLVSQSKSRIYELINTVYTRPNTSS